MGGGSAQSAPRPQRCIGAEIAPGSEFAALAMRKHIQSGEKNQTLVINSSTT
jgi:hypothetical protein